MNNIRPAAPADASRVAEIEIFNYRLNFYPIFRNYDFYFGELQVASAAENLRRDPGFCAETFVYDDGVVKGFIRIDGGEVKKLFVEPVLQRQGVGAALLEYAVSRHNVARLWALEKNEKAIRFYARHDFFPTGERRPEEDTDEYLILLQR